MGARSKLIRQRRRRADPLLGAAYAPSGYAFTGELRRPKWGESFLVAASGEVVAALMTPGVQLDMGINDGRRWILEPENYQPALDAGQDARTKEYHKRAARRTT